MIYHEVCSDIYAKIVNFRSKLTGCMYHYILAKVVVSSAIHVLVTCVEKRSIFFEVYFSSISVHSSGLLESLCYSLYDTLRPVIIHINHLETLADLCSIFKVGGACVSGEVCMLWWEWVELLARMMGLLERVEGLLVGVSRCACQTVGVLVMSYSSE